MTRTFPTAKVFGERNTATNAMKALIETNSSTVVLPSMEDELGLNLVARTGSRLRKRIGYRRAEALIDRAFRNVDPTHSWKHRATDFDDLTPFLDVLVVVMVRNPYSWLTSFHRVPYHALEDPPESFEEFVVSPWYPVRREGIGTDVTDPVELYNVKMRAHRDFLVGLRELGAEPVLVTFEEFVIDQEGPYERVKPYLVDANAEVASVESGTKTRRLKPSSQQRDRSYYQDFYRREAWKDGISDLARDRIGERVDWDVAAWFGYERWTAD